MELQVQELLERIKTEVWIRPKKKRRPFWMRQRLSDSIVASAEAKAAELDAATSSDRSPGKTLPDSPSSRIQGQYSGATEKVELFMREARKRTATNFSPALFWRRYCPTSLFRCESTEKDLSVLLPEKSLKALDSALAARLSAELGKKVLFKPFAGVDAGFYISVEAPPFVTDFSADAVAEILASRVNARLGECVKAALEEGRDS
jgi:hypothetical protein